MPREHRPTGHRGERGRAAPGHAGGQRPDQRPGKRPWQLPSVQFAIAVTALGVALSIYALATRPPASSAAAAGDQSRRGDPSALVSGLASGSQGDSPKSASPEPARRRAVDAAAPATLRLGASFLGAFTIGYFMRKFLRWSVLIVGLAVIAIFFLRRSGMINMPWDEIEGQVHEGASWLQSQAGSIKDVLTGYLPSSAAALLGGVVGFRRG